MEFLLADTPLFQGITEGEIQSLLQCLVLTAGSFPKVLLSSRRQRHRELGHCAFRMALISCSDVWGNNSVLGHIAPGAGFCGGVRPAFLGSRCAFPSLPRRHPGVVSECGTSADHLHQRLSFPHKTGAEFADGVCPQKFGALSADSPHQFQVHPGQAHVLLFPMCQTLREQFLSNSLQPPAAGRLPGG